MSTIAETIAEIVNGCIQSGEDPVMAVKDYFLEKDSYVTWEEARMFVQKYSPKERRSVGLMLAKITEIEDLALVVGDAYRAGKFDLPEPGEPEDEIDAIVQGATRCAVDLVSNLLLLVYCHADAPA